MTRAAMGRAMGATLGNARRMAAPREAAIVAANLRYLGLAAGAGKPEDEPLVRETFESFGLFVVEFFRGLSLPPQQLAAGWDITGWDHLEKLNRRSRGWILAGAHTGNWEHLGALAPLLGRKIVAPTGRQFLPGLSGAVKHAKVRRAIQSVPTRRGLRGLLRALDDGHLVALPVDGGSFQQGSAVHVLGRRVRLAEGAARLSVTSGCPILPVFSRRTDLMRQAVTVHAPLEPGAFAGPAGSNGGPGARSACSGEPAGNRDAVRAVLEELARLLGHQLVECPGQWCIFRSILPGAGRVRLQAPARARVAAEAQLPV